MISYFKISHASPFPFYKSTKALFFKNVRRNDIKSPYRQKWVRSDTTILVCESTIAPDPMQIITPEGEVIKVIPWTIAFDSGTYKIYKLTFDISDLYEGIFYIYQFVGLLDIAWEVYTEPIHSKDKWKDTILFEYWHDFNDYDVPWTLGIHFKFRCEAAVLDPNAELGRVAYLNQTKKIETQTASPFDTAVLHIGDRTGVPFWVMKIFKFILSCHHLYLSGSEYYDEGGYWQAVVDAKLEMSRVANYPKFAATIDIMPSTNSQSTEFNTADTELASGIVTAYNIETSWFGGKVIIPVTEIEQNS